MFFLGGGGRKGVRGKNVRVGSGTCRFIWVLMSVDGVLLTDTGLEVAAVSDSVHRREQGWSIRLASLEE